MNFGLNIEQLKKTYTHGTDNIPVLQGLDLQLKRAESAAIMGPSGSGKSTLLSLIGGLDRPSEGQITINNQNIFSLNEEELTSFRGENIGIVFQQYHLMPYLTAVENVSLPLEIAANDKPVLRSEEALQQVGLAHRLKHYPHQLSGGECQRVAIARALVTRPHLLLADEPSGNLDNKTGTEVLSLLFDLIHHHKMTTVIVTHSDELARRCDHQYSLVEGKLHLIEAKLSDPTP